MGKKVIILAILLSVLISGCQNNPVNESANDDINTAAVNSIDNKLLELSPDKKRSAYISANHENGLNSLSIYNIARDETKIYPDEIFNIPLTPTIVKWLDNQYLLLSAEYGTIEKKKSLYLFDTITETYYIVENIGNYKEVTGIHINEDKITIDYAKLDTEYKQYGTGQEIYTYAEILDKAGVESYEKVIDLNEDTTLYFGGRNSIYVQVNEEIIPLGRDYSSYPEISPDKSRIAYIDPNEQDNPRTLYIYDFIENRQFIILESDLNGANTPKVVKWLDDRYLIMIAGYAYGTVNLGGELYIYDLENETLLPALTPEENTEFRNILVDGDLITLDVARWTDTNMSEYIIEKREISYKELLANLALTSTE